MANPKIADLVARAKQLGIKNEDDARALIKTNKVATFGKLEKVISGKGGGKAAASARSIPTPVAKQLLKTSKVKVHARKGSRGGKVNMPGPRGYRLGAVWLKSIAEGKGAALKPANLPKLIATAQVRGVRLPRNAAKLPQKDLVTQIARGLHS